MWDNFIHYRTYEEIQTWFTEQDGYGGTSPELIAKVLKEKGTHIKHLIITTDGYISSSNVKRSDNLLNELGWKPEYVTVYIIGKHAKDVSVVTPYVRESPHIIYDVSIDETKIIEDVLPHNIKSFNEIPNIKSKIMFIKQYPCILNYMFSKCRGKEADPELVDNINKLVQNLKLHPTNVVGYETKIECLKDLSSGVTKDNYDKTTDNCTLKSGMEVKIEVKPLSNDNFILKERQKLKKNPGIETNLKSIPQDLKFEGGVGNKINFLENIIANLKKVSTIK